MRKVSSDDQVYGLPRSAPKAPATGPSGPVQQSGKAVQGAGPSAAAQKLVSPAPTSDVSVPDGAESMTPRDIQRVLPRVIEMDTTKAPLPKKLPVSRKQLEAELPFLLSKEARAHASFARENGRDYLCIVGKLENEVTRIELAAKDVGPRRGAPVQRIAQIARTAPAHKPLLGLRVAIDPGHFGDVEDLREGKFVTVGTPPKDPQTVPADGLTEGDLNAISARNLARRLTEKGAEVIITRQGRVLRTENRAYVNAMLDADPELAKRAGNRGAFLTALDLERRAERMASIQPDVIITMHFDAEVNQVIPDARDEVKIYVPGCFSRESLESKLGKSRFVQQCASSSWTASADLAAVMVRSICATTGAIPQLPGHTGAVDPKFLNPVGDDKPGVFARSLRLPHAVAGEPLSVYLEGATYNHDKIFPQMFRDRGTTYGQPGGYLDRYAQSLAEGLEAYVKSKR